MNNTANFMYFAYGSNLNLKDLTKWEKEHVKNIKKSFKDSINILDEIFFLPDYQLQFSVDSHTRKGGVLDVTPMVGHAVAGKLFVLENWDLLKSKENAPDFYKKIPVTVIDENGKTFDAFTYVVNSKNKTKYVKPNPDYVKIVSKGYKEFGILEKFPWAYENLISASKNQKCKMIDSMFVYGTLRKQECRENIMNKISLNFKNITIRAKMYDIGEFPAIILKNGIVYGEFHKIGENSISILDEIEGFQKYNKLSMYYRVLINTSEGICWTYVWNRDIVNYKIIQSGNWKDR